MKRPRVPVLLRSAHIVLRDRAAHSTFRSPVSSPLRNESYSQGLVPLDLPGLLALENNLVLGRGVEADLGEPRSPGARDLRSVEVVLDEVNPALTAGLLLARVVVLVVPVAELVLTNCWLATNRWFRQLGVRDQHDSAPVPALPRPPTPASRLSWLEFQNARSEAYMVARM